MKTNKSRKTRTVTFAVLVLLISATSVLAYPPDNAAVLYYKAFMLYESPDNIGTMLWDYWKGKIKSNEKIEEFLKKNRRVIDIALDATRIDHCDWGLDYSQGTEVLLPPHHKARDIFALLAAEARMQADRGDYKKALGRCISIYRMARHLNERPIISYLVGIAINAANNQCITLFLSEMPLDTEILTWLRGDLTELDKQPFSIKPVLRWKRKAGIISMSPERISDVVQSGLDDGPTKKKILERIRTANEQFFAKNITYWNNYMDGIEAAFDLPYPQGYEKLKKLDEELTKEFNKNTDATLTASLAPTWARICSLSIRFGTHSNAIKAAIEIYIIKAKTGKLPDALPVGLPGDLFSSKDFKYEKTTNGFILSCQGKDLSKDEIYKYEFKIKK
ncbi:MAG: hypothetical protein HQ580_12405 [Planctomycetes bacterium]|nr:hypothetical protein [Planctomycetota bacterium]